MKLSQNPPNTSSSPDKNNMEKVCRHARVRVVAREDDAEFVECQECGDVFECPCRPSVRSMAAVWKKQGWRASAKLKFSRCEIGFAFTGGCCSVCGLTMCAHPSGTRDSARTSTS